MTYQFREMRQVRESELQTALICFAKDMFVSGAAPSTKNAGSCLRCPHALEQLSNDLGFILVTLSPFVLMDTINAMMCDEPGPRLQRLAGFTE